MNAIETNALTKAFGATKAVNDLSLHVRRGEIYGFLGLNGAGKTTTIRMMLGMIKPTIGESNILGSKILPSKGTWESIGYMVESPGSYPNLSVEENLKVIFQLRRLKDKSDIDKIIEKLYLEKYRNVKAKYLSLGNFQRLGLAKALIHRPQILILDEPTNGLDPEGIVEIRELLKDLVSNHGVTVFISSHILGEISKIATRIGIIHEGRLVQEINTKDLEISSQRRLVVDTKNNEMASTLFKNKSINFNKKTSGLIEITDETFIENPETIAVLLVNENLPPRMIKVEEEDLEEYFLRIIKQ